MKVKILLLLVVLIANVFATESKPGVCAPLKKEAGKCICYATNKPVCGVTGRTYKNACFAKCVGDKVKHEGKCYKQCTKKVKKHKECVTKKYGQFGKRKWCCSYETVCWGKDCTKTDKSCQWSGETFYRYGQHKCTWEKVNPTTRQKRCCSWFHVCEGDKCVDTKKVCVNGRKEVRTPYHKCSKKPYASGTRTRCCSGTNLCITEKGKSKCYQRGHKCKFTGVVEYTKQKEKCEWKQATSVHYKKVRQCQNIEEKYDHVIDFLTAKELRDRALRRCQHKDKFIMYSCVFDESKGLLKVKEEYERVAEWLKQKNGGARKCYSSGDPHIKTFTGKTFDVYNIEQNRRVVYQKEQLKVSTDVKFNKNWGTRGVNVAAYVEYAGKSFAVRVPPNGKWLKPECNGLTPRESGNNSVKKYEFKEGSTDVTIEVNSAGYINVFVSVAFENSVNCSGDCCQDAAKVKHEVTLKQGDANLVEFSNECHRKQLAVRECKDKHKDEKSIIQCIKLESKNYVVETKKVERHVFVRQCKNVAEKYDNVVDFFTALQLRERAIARCKHEDQFVFYSCVFDESAGLLRQKEEYIKIANYLKNIPKGEKKCYSNGDPHIRNFDGKGFTVLVKQNKRVLFQKGDISVTCDTDYNPRLRGDVGLNSAVYVTHGTKTWSVALSKNGGRAQCGGNGQLKVVRDEGRYEDTYEIDIGKIQIDVTVVKEGYIDVFVKAPTVDTINCTGDCCSQPKPQPVIDKNVTWKWGDPYKVVFTDECKRKEQAVEECTKNTKHFHEVQACLIKLSKNTAAKKTTKVVTEEKIYHYNEKKVQRVVVKEKGKRYRCCTLVLKCYGKTCKVLSRKCKWISTTIYKKRHFKCELKKYGQNGQRKRCCIWTSKCTHKKCKVTFKKCFWKGCVIYTWNKYKCTWKRINKFLKKEQCCHFKKQCKGLKCHTFDKKCKWGRTVTTKYHHNCETKKYGRFGTRKWCCKHKHHCVDKKCTKTSDCKWVGKITIVRHHNKCEITEFKDNRKCNYCCRWKHTCEDGDCRESEKQCECKGKVTRWWFKEKCVLKKISKDTRQNECCTWRKECEGDVCKVKDKKCYFIGFPFVITKHKKCVMKVKEDGKSRQLYCCHHHKECNGPKCKIIPKGCHWKGLIYKKTKVVKCVRKTFGCKGNTRKWCCEYVKSCKGTFCKNKDKHCEWRGLVRTKKIKKTVVWKVYKKNAKRRWVCKWIEVCEGGKCHSSKKKCGWKGYAIYTHKRETTEWRWKSKNVKQKYYCVWYTRCVNNMCKTTQKKQCRYVGKVIKITHHKECKMARVAKHSKRKRCEYWTNVCTDDKCVIKNKYVKWVGKVITIKSKLVCKWKETKQQGKKHRYCCRYILKCHGEKCKNLFAPNCYFSSSKTTVKKKECKWVFVKPPTPKLWLKQKKCKYWTQVCHSKKGCEQYNIVFKWEGKVIKKRHYVECKPRYFGTNHKRNFCCHKTEICHGTKCSVHDHKCNWKGAEWKVSTSYELFRWRTVCKDETFGQGSDIRLQCCKEYQKCVQSKDHFKCDTIKKGNCWWRGAARGDVHIFEGGQWKELNVVGTFKYLIDETKNIGIYTQFTKTGTGSSTTAVAIKTPTNVVTLETKDGKLVVLLNGKPAKQLEKVQISEHGHFFANGQVVTFQFSQERLIVTASEKVFEFSVELNPSDKAEGIFVTGTRNPEKQAITFQQSQQLKLGFTVKVDYAVLPDVETVGGIDAEKCCSGLEAEPKQQCIDDTNRTGECFKKHYEAAKRIDFSKLKKD